MSIEAYAASRHFGKLEALLERDRLAFRQKMAWLLSAACVLAATVVLAGGWIGCDRGLHPTQAADTYSLSQFDLPSPQAVSFHTRDGLRLAGWFMPGTNGATVVLVHGRGGTRMRMLPHAHYLHRDGFSVLLFDLRYRGESEGQVSTLGAKEAWDIEDAVRYLRNRSEVDPERIGVQGGSLGAVSAILAAAHTPEIKGVVAEIPFADLRSAIAHSFHHHREGVGLPSFPFAPMSMFFCEVRLGIDIDDVSPKTVIGMISPRPVFLIDDLEDDRFPSDSVEVLYEVAGEPKALWQIQALHGKGWETAPKEYERRVLAFWRQTFGIAQVQSSNISG